VAGLRARAATLCTFDTRKDGRAPDKPAMIPASAPPAQPEDWRLAFRNAIQDPGELLECLGLPALAAHLPSPGFAFPLRVPREFVARMRHADPDDPLLRQVLPLDAEYRPQPGFDLDAVGDLAARGDRGVLHKYQGRALAIATGNCAVHCRYCFRRHFPYADELAATRSWEPTLRYLEAAPDVNELILSGGDPWSLATHKLAELTDRLRDHPRLLRLRIHTRLPIVIPQRVDAALLGWLEALPWQRVVVVHVNHAQEIDDAVRAALARLAASGARLLNQSVLLRGVNDSTDALQDLSEALMDAGVMPYYLHQLDKVQGAAHFLVDDSRAMALMEALRRRLPGYLVPRLVRETAGQPYKSPI